MLFDPFGFCRDLLPLFSPLAVIFCSEYSSADYESLMLLNSFILIKLLRVVKVLKIYVENELCCCHSNCAAT
jgi:hypothetical protein